MSIFPKRTIPGKEVTIHWNFNTSHLKEKHLFPLVKIGVRDPNGKITMLFEKHVLAFPDEKEELQNSSKKLKYLNKNIPLLVIADYLEGPCKREKLIDILTNIQAGRHYYLTFKLPNDAPLGKYSLISEIHNQGNIKHSKTQRDDHFWVEKVSLVDIDSKNRNAKIHNDSEESTPVKIIRCSFDNNGNMKTEVEACELEGNQTISIAIPEEKVFLLYNEERETIPLTAQNPLYLIKNHEILSIKKDNGLHCLMEKDKDEAYWLDPDSTNLWDKSDGLLNIENLSEKEQEILEEMEGQGLIKKITI